MFLQTVGRGLPSATRAPSPVQNQIVVKVTRNLVEVTTTVSSRIAQLIAILGWRVAKPFGLNRGELPVHCHLRGGMWHIVRTLSVRLAGAALSPAGPESPGLRVHAAASADAVAGGGKWDAWEAEQLQVDAGW